MTGPFIDTHEELTSSMTQAERNHVLDVRRLSKQSVSAIPEIRLAIARGPRQALDGTNLVTVDSRHEVSIEQEDRDTSSILVRRMIIQSEQYDSRLNRPVLDEVLFPDDVKHAKRKYNLFKL